MSGLIGGLQKFVNRLLPFATPGTPLVQDIVHLAVLCTVLYFAPQIQTYYRSRVQTDVAGTSTNATDDASPQEAPATDGDFQQGQQPQQQQEAQQGNFDEPHDPIEQADRIDDNDMNNQAPQPDDGDPGPANPMPARPTPPAREVGKKKAKSLARRDQKRAYHEFMRSQGEAQRAQEAEGAAEREAALAEERERRAAVETEVRAREAREREERRNREAQGREMERRRREMAIGFVRQDLQGRGMCRLEDVARRVGDVDAGWMEALVRVSGLLGDKDGDVVMLTDEGWVVRVGRAEMNECYRVLLSSGNINAGEDGRVSSKQIGDTLTNVIRSRAAAVR